MSDTASRKRRVRTGCLTCRSRKVKCDEARPACDNCTRVNRACLYQSPQLSHHCTRRAHREVLLGSPVIPAAIGPDEPVRNVAASGNTPSTTLMQEYQLNEDLWANPPSLDDDLMDFNFVTGEWGDLFPGVMDDMHQQQPSSASTIGPGPNMSEELPSVNESQFTYFSSHVEPPFITPWDSSDWALMKGFICQLAASCTAISTSIKAVDTLYESLLSNGDSSAALTKYFAAKSSYLTLLGDENSDIEIILITTFLLCSFEVVAQHETVPNTLKQKDALVTRLERRQQPWSPVSGRIICWLHLFHTKALHLSGRGFLSPRVLDLLKPPRTLLPLTSLLLIKPSASEASLQAMRQALFSFYFELQRISSEVSALNRHHRPRGGPEDELKVDHLSQDIHKRLAFLWQGRPWLLDLPFEEMSQIVFQPNDGLDDVTLLAALCIISYHAELIYHARGHGKSPFGSACITEARKEIRGVTTLARDTWPLGSKLHAAFLWPLFMYSVESTELEDVEWAIESMSLVSNALWSSSLIKELTNELSKAQLQKGVRVDSRYFCIEKFGMVPPFI